MASEWKPVDFFAKVEKVRAMKGLAPPTPPLDLEGAKRRYLRNLLGEEKLCFRCGRSEGVQLESARTAYHFEGVRGSPEDPNRPLPFCRECAAEHHAYWDEMWSEYRAGLGV